MSLKKSRAILSSVFFAALLHGAVGKISEGTDTRIRVEGTKYIQKTETGMRFKRFTDETLNVPAKELGVNPEKARNTTGIVLSFLSDSSKIEARFEILNAIYLGSTFGVYENGELIYETKFSRKQTEGLLLFESKYPGMSLFEIALPSHADVEFQGLEIDDGAKVEDVPDPEKKVYVALGDSITHGVGQGGAAHKTWPFLLSRKLDLELYNLAVGGGKVSVPIGAMLEDWDRIDLITILVGYNGLHFNGKTPESYAADYGRLLDAIRVNHPSTQIVCITLLYTRKPVSEKTGHTGEEFRQALAELVKARQATDKNLVLLAGDSITSEKNLSTEKPDPVHLSIEGATLFADELAEIIKID